MPQAPSPNMNIIWPVDKNDADAWDALMDTAVRVVIDGHTHAPGDGAQILISSLKIDQDISWASGGTKFGISDLKAIDFFPVAASTVAALAGAFFLSDGSGGLTANELYYRTTAGANVKVTNGAALNISAFSGGIGGDYTAIGALVEFNDASDAYWFEQQIGASVRQYAKMRCSDLALFEFKAVGVSPVPSFAVTLKSPAALAANYAVTLPGALPASTLPFEVSSAGVGAFGQSTRTLQISPMNIAGGGPWQGNIISGSDVVNGIPIELPNGSRITAVRARIKDSVTGPTTIRIALKSTVDHAASVTIATGTTSSGAGTAQTLTATGLTTTMVSGTNYFIGFDFISGATGCQSFWGEVDYDRLV